MSFIDTILSRAKQDVRKILLPEPEDERTLHAADKLEEMGVCRVALIGDEAQVSAKLQELGIARTFEIVDPAKSSNLDQFTQTFFEMRKAKGMTEDKAALVMQEPIPHGIMMLHHGMGDGLVAGAIHSTADTLRPALQILKTAPGVSIVSSFFFMACEEKTYLFADCALVEDPNAEQLAEIALSTAGSALAFGMDPCIALLSYSTKGSASSPQVTKVVEATKIAQDRLAERFGDDAPVQLDGELQADAAIVNRVGKKKAPDSAVAGNANVLVFPDLNAGNIAYKLVQYLGGAEAYGPVVQGLRLPVNDLSRGCSADDIVGVAAITAIQSQMLSK